MLSGDRVTLRPVEPGDAPFLDVLFAIPSIAEAWPGDNDGRLATAVETGVVGLIVEAPVDDGAQAIGFIQYAEEHDPNYRSASIDIVLHPDWCNRGLGTDAVRTLARHLFDEVGHHRITIDPRSTNLRAIASYRKVGFRDVGVMRQYEKDNEGAWHDALLMDLLRDELA
jgi:aminoglycoside 6'-N-acetyltransferase